MTPPYQYFGGKASIADDVWRRLGRPDTFIDPFFGGCSLLLARPLDFDCLETINDKDAFVANFWRAVQHDPDQLADLMNWPVNEVDLEARHKWLCTQPAKRDFEQRMHDDPDFYDVKRAAWWCWGLCQWIGTGWCCGNWYGRDDERNSGVGINVADEDRGGKLPHLGDKGRGVHRKRPHLGDKGMGVHRKLPHLGNKGRGVHRQLPHLGDKGMGVHRKLPHLGNKGMGECERKGDVLRDWMGQFCDRMRNVRVCCGDWKRVLGPSVTFKHGIAAVVLDPPYSAEASRHETIYKEEDLSVAHDVRDWAIEAGRNPLMRVALFGYEGEHAMPTGWDCVAWKASGGYASQGSNGDINRHRERIWYSPACVPVEQGELFR